jgi:hypothetical protein
MDTGVPHISKKSVFTITENLLSRFPARDFFGGVVTV